MSKSLTEAGEKPQRFNVSLHPDQAEELHRFAGERYAAGNKSGISGAIRDLIGPALRRRKAKGTDDPQAARP